jgi:hypothetical protein
MLMISRVQTEARTTCIIQLEDHEVYNQDALVNVCSHPSKLREGWHIRNILEHEERYMVSVKTGWEPGDDVFAKMVKEYGKA